MSDFAFEFGDALLVAGCQRNIANIIDVDNLAALLALILLNFGREELAILTARLCSGLTANRRPLGGVGGEGAKRRQLRLEPGFHEEGKLAAANLILAVAEQSLCVSVEVQDCAVEARHDERLWRILQAGAQR